VRARAASGLNQGRLTPLTDEDKHFTIIKSKIKVRFAAAAAELLQVQPLERAAAVYDYFLDAWREPEY
jgi:hypothetical protein